MNTWNYSRELIVQKQFNLISKRTDGYEHGQTTINQSNIFEKQ